MKPWAKTFSWQRAVRERLLALPRGAATRIEDARGAYVGVAVGTLNKRRLGRWTQATFPWGVLVRRVS
jgi:hypothetical protein